MSWPAPKPKLPPRIGNYNNIITFKFYRYCRLSNIEFVELGTYKEFFDFYMQNHNKGCIYDVEIRLGELE